MIHWPLCILTYISLSLASQSGASRSLERSSSILPFRLSLHVIDGAFSEANKQHLIDKVIPSVEDFYASALNVYRVEGLLKPLNQTCNSIRVPESHLKEGLAADTIIYINSDAPYEQIAVGKFCERESGTYKRPLVGSISVNFVQFFYFLDTLQVEYLIREVAHVLAFDKELFKDFVKYDGSKYFDTQYSLRVNYPARGKTVETIAFPEMLDRARDFFACEIEGLELEDFFNEETDEISQTFWDLRVMTHDIMSSKMSPYAVFSDITLALFKDSGWYFPDYTFSQKMKQGQAAGCDWFEKKCIQNEEASLPGFCDLKTGENICDYFDLGYGNCKFQQRNFIPPFEQYFKDTSKGGNEFADFCPMIVANPQTSCRNDRQSSNKDIGEAKGRDSRCLMQNLMQIGKNFDTLAKPVGGCYIVESCQEEAVTIKVGTVIVDCPFGSQITVSGYQGYILCPKSYDFCLNLPCPSLCNGRGSCFHGTCMCEEGRGGVDCQIECQSNCRTCSSSTKCDVCGDGFYLQLDKCLPCDSNCLTCLNSPFHCTGCKVGFGLDDQKCVKGCLANCATCDKPCTKCDSGFFLESGSCKSCIENCKECSGSANSCISCHDGFKVYNGICLPECLTGCQKCENPCTACKTGFLLANGSCDMCDNVCATCVESTSKCTSCITGFILKNNTCVQGCIDNCLSCDQPCSKCEDGFYPISGLCAACDKNCLTCLRHPSICTSCKVGYYLKGASCLQQCVKNCKSCSFPCSQCEEGYFEDQGLCSKCADNCKTCGGLETNCLSCNPGFGLVYNECRPGCSDHCFSCDSPCSVCAQGYYSQNGVCLRCDESCLLCTASGSNHCVVCAEGYTKVASYCKKGCQEHCLTCDEPCSSCENGYFKYELGCQKCMTGCATCLSLDKCLVCEEGFGLIGNSCQKQCLDHCTFCDNPCSVCESGFYIKEGKCEKCQEGCLTCLGLNNCKSCNDGYQISGTKCIKGCVENCQVCENPCQSCNPGYVVNEKGLCSVCPTGCQTCAADMSRCYSCKSGYYYDNYLCKKECLPFCLSCDEPCSNCEPGFLSISGTCVPCLHPCSSCVGNLDRCSSCKEGFKLDDFSCIASCVDHCKTCDEPCEICEEGFLPFKGICQSCSPSCRTCSGTPSHCTSCNPWEELENNSCTKVCVENCIDCSYPCRVCKEGFALVKGKCASCKNYLGTNDVTAEFIKNFSGLSVKFSKPVLNVVDNCNQYFKIQTLAMIGIQAICSWDKEDRLVVIFGENPDYNIRTLLMYPVIAYGSNCASEEVNLEVKIHASYLPRPHASLVAPATFSIGCGYDALIIQALTDEEIFSFTFETEPKQKGLESYLNSLSGKALVVPESELAPTNLTILLTVTNILNLTTHVAKQVIITSERHLSSFIDTGSRLLITTSQSYSINGIVQFGTCFVHEKLVYFWKYIQTSGQPSKAALLIESNSRGSNKLFIPKNSLKPGIYLFQFQVQNDLRFTYSQVEIDVISSKLVAKIDRSSSSVPVSEKLILSAESSYDPDDESSVLRFAWSCDMLTTNCLDSQGKPLITSSNSPTLTIGAMRLRVGSTYMFTVRVSKDDRVSQDSIFITGSSSHIFAEVDQIIDEVDVGKDLFVYPRYYVGNDECLFNWKPLSGTPAVKTMTRPDDPYLIINKNEMVNGQTYNFNLTATCENDTFFSEVSWFTNSPPECSNLVVQTEGNSVSVVTNCIDKDSGYSPLSYVYGVVFSKRFVPLKVVHSPSMILHLKAGNWTIYVDVCDHFKVCRRFTQNTQVVGRKLSEGQHLYQLIKYYPDSIPLAILNSADSFNSENFKEAFDDLKHYFNHQQLDLIYLKMAIEALEILTFSNKTHFMTNYQAEIVELLHKTAEKIEYVDDEVIGYVIALFSEHKVLEFDKVSALIHQLCGKWNTQLPPGQINTVSSAIKLTRHRFVGHESNRTYNSSYSKVSNLILEGNPVKVYDLVLVFYPASPFPVVDINYYSIGEYSSFTYTMKEARDEISIDILQPFYIDFNVQQTGNFQCQQLRGGKWINEGCEIIKKTENSVQIATWHLSTFRVIKAKNTERGIVALMADVGMIAVCLILTSIFCIADKSKANYIQAPFVPDSPDSPRNYPAEGNFDEEKKKEIDDRRNTIIKLSVASSVDSLRPFQIPVILYHPWFNLVFSQNGERRAASTLHMFAVLFGEFLAAGVLFNPSLNEVFDENDEFTGFSNSQIIVSVIGLVLVQIVSVLLVYLNQVNDFTITKKYLGMTISSIFIVVCSGTSLILAYSYPQKCSLYWVYAYLAVVFGEVAIFQNLYWLIYYKISPKYGDISVTRNMRVFTTES